jgi:hypothetical protein
MVLFVVKILAAGVRRVFDSDMLSIYASNAIWEIPANIEAFLEIFLVLEIAYVVPVERSIWHRLSL